MRKAADVQGARRSLIPSGIIMVGRSSKKFNIDDGGFQGVDFRSFWVQVNREKICQ